jgi:hypothetical protein
LNATSWLHLRVYLLEARPTHGNHRPLGQLGEMTSTATRVALVFSLVCAATSIVSVRAPAGDSASLPVQITHTGQIVRGDRGHTIERTFVVPPGAAQLDIDFAVSHGDTVVALDFGVRGPNGWRGWSEDRNDHIHIDASSASYGYLPGPIEAGVWSVIVGVANVADTVPYRVAIRVSGTRDAAAPVLQTRAGWYVGDLHAHSGHSDGYHINADGTREPVSVRDVSAAAERAKLDFVAVTDHNTTSHWLDLDRAQTANARVLLLHGSEITTYRGHFNAIGARRPGDLSLNFTRPMAVLTRDWAERGAFVSINHPLSADDEWCGGCRWADLDPIAIGSVGGIEIANGPTGGDLPAWRLWADLLNTGLRLVAVGGSDAHDPAGERPLGRPATVVHASALSETAIVEGLARGEVYVRTDGVAGPSIDMRATSGSTSTVMGGTLPSGHVTLTAHIDGARGQDCLWIKNGREIAVHGLASNSADASIDADATAGDWFSLIVRAHGRPTLLSNAVYIDPAR